MDAHQEQLARLAAERDAAEAAYQAAVNMDWSLSPRPGAVSIGDLNRLYRARDESYRAYRVAERATRASR